MVSPLLRGLLTFPQVGLCLNEVRLEQRLGIFLLGLGARGPEVFLKLPRFCDEAVGNADRFPLWDGIDCCIRVFNTLVQPRIEDFKWFVRIVGLLEIPVVLHQARRQYSRVVRVEVAK